MAKLKEKKIEQMKGNPLECAKFEDFMMKEIQHEYEQLLAMMRDKKTSKTRGTGSHSYFQEDKTSQAERSLEKNA